MKVCTKCKEPKDESEFHKNKGKRDGLESNCKTCKKIQTTRYYIENREARLDYKSRYYALHADIEREKARQWRLRNIERRQVYQKQYYQDNIDKVRQWWKQWSEKHGDSRRFQACLYRAQNPEKSRDAVKRYKRSLKGVLRNKVNNAKRRARLLAAEGQFTKEDLQIAFKSQKGKCWWCGCGLPDKYHADHRIPLARGGSNKPGNIVLACPHCNLSKQDKLPHEWNGRLL